MILAIQAIFSDNIFIMQAVQQHSSISDYIDHNDASLKLNLSSLCKNNGSESRISSKRNIGSNNVNGLHNETRVYSPRSSRYEGSIFSPRECIGCEYSMGMRSPRDYQILVSFNTFTELENSKKELLNSLKRMQSKYCKAQSQKIEYFNEIQRLKNKISKFQLAENYAKDQIHSFNLQNRRLRDQLNYERELCADYQSENLILKSQLKNFNKNEEGHSCLEILHKNQEKIFSTISSFNKQIIKVSKNCSGLQEQLDQLRQQQQKFQQIKKNLFVYIQHLEGEAVEEKNIIQVQNGFKNQVSLIRQKIRNTEVEELKEKVQSQEREIKRLQNQILRGRKKSFDYQLMNPQAVTMRTNSEYLTKIIAEHSDEVEKLRRTIDEKDQAVEMLERENRQRLQKYQKMKEELILVESWRIKEEKITFDFTEKMEKVLKEKDLVGRHLENLTEKYKKAQDEIKSKDKLIMSILSKQKLK